MFGRSLMALLAFLFVTSSTYGMVVDGIDLPETLTIGNETLVLNGAGVRAKRIAFINKGLYVAGLYLKAKSDNPRQIMDADETMSLRIKITSSLITTKRFAEATLEGFEEATSGNTVPIQQGINSIMGAFSDEIKEGDQFDIVYTPDVGVQVFKNGSDQSLNHRDRYAT